jgi:hypothetical protein
MMNPNVVLKPSQLKDQVTKSQCADLFQELPARAGRAR